MNSGEVSNKGGGITEVISTEYVNIPTRHSDLVEQLK